MYTENFKTEGHALVYMVECTMATLEKAKLIRRTAKNEITRLESIVSTGLAACKTFKLYDVAHETRCHRVARLLNADRDYDEGRE